MKLFGGVRVGFQNAQPPTEALRATLLEHGAQIVKSATDEVDFVIVDEVAEVSSARGPLQGRIFSPSAQEGEKTATNFFPLSSGCGGEPRRLHHR